MTIVAHSLTNKTTHIKRRNRFRIRPEDREPFWGTYLTDNPSDFYGWSLSGMQLGCGIEKLLLTVIETAASADFSAPDEEHFGVGQNFFPVPLQIDSSWC